MKNIILLATALLLSLSFIGCEKDGAPPEGKAYNVLNKTTIPLRIQQDTATVLELESNECVSLTQEQLHRLVIKENDTREFLKILTYPDQVVCSNIDVTNNSKPCIVTETSIVVENEEGGHQLVDDKKAAEEARVKKYNEEENVSYNFSECKSLEEEEAEEEA